VRLPITLELAHTVNTNVHDVDTFLGKALIGRFGTDETVSTTRQPREKWDWRLDVVISPVRSGD